MPEGPQVYRIAQRLREILKGSILDSIDSHEKGSTTSAFEGDSQTDASVVSHKSRRLEVFASETGRHANIEGLVIRIITKGKRLVIILDNGHAVLITFALSGKLEYDNSPVSERYESSIATMKFSSDVSSSGTSIDTLDSVGSVEQTPKREIYITLRDPQRLASVHYDRLRIIMTLLPRGFDPLHTITGMREWLALCKAHSGKLIATFLSDQNLIAGIGNRYRSEIMHNAVITPDAKVKDLCSDHLQVLLVTIYRVLKMASRGEYVYSVFGRKETEPEGLPVTRVEVAKGVQIWTTTQDRKSASKDETEDSTLARKPVSRGRIAHQ